MPKLQYSDIRAVLQNYDQQKGLLRKYVVEQSDIADLRPYAKESDEDLTHHDFVDILRILFQHQTLPNHASREVIVTLQDKIFGESGQLISQGVSLNHARAIAKHFTDDMYARDYVKLVLSHPSPQRAAFVLTELKRMDLLKDESLRYIAMHEQLDHVHAALIDCTRVSINRYPFFNADGNRIDLKLNPFMQKKNDNIKLFQQLFNCKFRDDDFLSERNMKFYTQLVREQLLEMTSTRSLSQVEFDELYRIHQDVLASKAENADARVNKV